MRDASGPWDDTWRLGTSGDGLVVRGNGTYVAECGEDDGPLIAAAPAMARLLCRLEWSSVQDETGCVVCGEFADGDVPEHTADCLLDAALTQAGISPEERERVRQK